MSWTRSGRRSVVVVPRSASPKRSPGDRLTTLRLSSLILSRLRCIAPRLVLRYFLRGLAAIGSAWVRIAGRMIDRHGGRDVLTITNLVFTAGLVLMSIASRRLGGLALAWAVIGSAWVSVSYQASFATVAVLYGRDARNAITGITLFAGFASTVGWPASALLHRSSRLARCVPRLGRAASRDRPADVAARNTPLMTSC